MCSTSLNRRNVIRTVKEGGVTGRTLRDCAGCVAARLGHGTEGTQKAFEILVALEKSFRVVLNDAELRYVSEEERDGFLKRAASSALRVQGTLRRTKQHRAGGIRRLPVSPCRTSGRSLGEGLPRLGLQVVLHPPGRRMERRDR